YPPLPLGEGRARAAVLKPLETLMKYLTLFTSIAVLSLLGPSTALAGETPPPNAPSKAKNWTPPATKIYAQTLSDEIMAKHPELISVTFHGVPPGLSKLYTMFAGSFPERIGNPDDPDDIDVITKGITIVDPRWNRNDPVKKFVVLMPLRNASG